MQEDRELDHTLLNQQVLVPQLFLLLTEEQLSLLALLLFGLVLFLHLVHLPPFLKEAGRWRDRVSAKLCLVVRGSLGLARGCIDGLITTCHV